MKRILTMTCIALTLFAVGCKKDKKESSSDYGSWTLAGKTYKVAYSAKTTTSGGTPTTLYIFSDAVLTGSNPTANTFNLSFKTPPTSSGSYELVSVATSNLTDKQFQLSAGGSATGTYAYIGSTIGIHVTVNNGKIEIAIPEITMKSTSSQPDAKFSATVKEM